MADTDSTRGPLESAPADEKALHDAAADTDGAIHDDVLDAVSGGTQQPWARLFGGR